MFKTKVLATVRRMDWRKLRATVDRLTWPLPKTKEHIMASLIGKLWWESRKVMNSNVLYEVNFLKFGEVWIGSKMREIMREIISCNLRW